MEKPIILEPAKEPSEAVRETPTERSGSNATGPKTGLIRAIGTDAIRLPTRANLPPAAERSDLRRFGAELNTATDELSAG